MMPFNSNWALKPSPECQRQFLCYHWSTRSAWGEGKRNLAFGVYLLESEQLIGSIDLFTADVRLREFGMGAWLLKPFQDQHFGQEAGQALLHLAFETIGVDRVHAGFWHDNHRSGRAQLAAGGVVTHDEWRIRHSADGQEHAERMCGVRITPETWVRPKFPIAVEGFEPCRNLLVADS
jgi:RimJ/RimL family protein N-acetyltransferase